MKVLARYISGIFLKNFTVAVLALTFLYLFQELLGQLFEQRYAPYKIVFYNILNIPQIFVQMTPPSVLMAAVLTLSGLSRTNELIACYSIGIGLRQLMTVIMSLVFMLSCFSLVMQDRILPPFFKKRTTYYWREMKKKNDFFLDFKQDKIWYRSGSFIYNLRTFDPKNQTIHGMAIYSFDPEFNLIRVTEAKEAAFKDGKWTLKQGTTTQLGGIESVPASVPFEEQEFVIAETPNDFQEIEKEVDGLRLKELYRYIARIKDSGIDSKAYEVKLHYRISLSFIPLVMCLLAIPFSIKGRREGGVAKDLGICLAVTFFYWLFYSIGLSLGTNGALPPWLAAWLPSFTFVVLAVTLIYYRRQ